MRHLPLFLLPSLLAAAATTAAVEEPTKEQLAFFEGKIRPILSESCYKCHSVEQGKSKGGLTLDSREGWTKGGENGEAVKPGDPENSLLIHAVRYEDPDMQMPPKGEKLSDQQIADLTAWVKMGAPDPRKAGAKAARLSGLNDNARQHWAFQPVKMPAVPQPEHAGWIQTPVDAFILAKLQANGMKPSAPASREALLRRATYDLIGLPPTPEELQAFVQDKSPDAFAKVVDRLLASPHYGERWGRYWLDSARYSDTHGGERNLKEEYRYPYAWTYRDYVIKALNDDKPYDQFLIEQIAADKLPDIDKDPSRLAALGFLTVGERFRNVNDTINERIDTLTKATQALTVSCARCHDHTFDPIPQADYYSLHGIFSSTIEPKEKPLLSHRADDPQLLDFERRLGELEKKDQDHYYDLMDRWLGDFRAKTAGYLMAAHLTRGGRKATTNEQVAERNRLIREGKLDEELVRNIARFARRDDPVLGPFVRFAELPAETFAEKAKEVAAQIAADKGVARRAGPTNPQVKQAFAEVQPQSLQEVADIYAKLFSGIEGQARAYLAACRTATGDTIEGYAEDLVQLIQTPVPVELASNLTTDKLMAAVDRLPFRNNTGYGAFLFAEINELKLTHPGAPARAMAVADAPQPKNSPIFIRGEAQSRGAIVPRRYLEIVSGKDRKPFSDGSGRLELAQAIASKSNPLTARAMINRIWMRHFGEGFVRTPDDLGVQSEKPSHPELLDYLAARFMDEGWSIKSIHRLIMLSAAYQQSSDTKAEYAQKDPDNRLLWRANIRRLDFEAIRDSMLTFSGKLDQTLGGKPINLTDEPYSYRRSVYGYIDRGNLPELMSQFDFADPEMANSKRTTTIVPQQALFFMNSPMCVDVARKAVTRPEFAGASDDESRVRALYQLLFQRAPRPEEIAFAQEFVASAEAARSDIQQAANKKVLLRRPQPNQRRKNAISAILNEGEFVERKALGVWEQYAQALLFTNEIAYVN